MHNVFISYSSKDIAQAQTVRDVLEKNGIACWMAPRDIPGGSNYTREIPIAIRGCQVFVLMLSRNAQSSPWVLKELDSAVNSGKVIMPFMLEDCKLNDEFNFLLTGAQRYTAYQKKMEALETLVNRIHAVTGRNAGVRSEISAPAEGSAASAAPAGIDPVICPACGGIETAELGNIIGRYTPAEWLTLIPVALASVGAFALAAALMLFILVMFAPFALILILSLAAGITAAVFAWRWADGFALERIRRNRVRNRIGAHPYRCSACMKQFLAEK